MPSTSSSSQLNDPLLHPFITPAFSPIAYLNSTLPQTPQPTTTKPSQPLSALASQTQSQISTLSARTATLSDTLTALTDDILRCSSRLTYEVELLRGEAVGLVEAMTAVDGELGGAIKRFVPGGLEAKAQQAAGGEEEARASVEAKEEDMVGEEAETKLAIERLRTMLHVKLLLQKTTQTFNSALSFALPPSLLASTSSSLISVNPPPADPTAEEKGQAALTSLRRDVADLLALDEGSRASEDDLVGLRRAREKIAHLREVVGVWKGTSEEKARMKVVEGLEWMVEEAVGRRRRSLEAQRGTVHGGKSAVAGVRRELTAESRGGGGGRGFLGGLQRLREEIYME